MTLYGWQAAGVVGLIGLGVAAFVGALWGWYQLCEHFTWGAWVQLGVPSLVLLAGMAVLVAVTGVRV